MLSNKSGALGFKKLVASCGIVLGTFFSAAPAGAVPILSFTSADPNINVGESVTIDATISGLVVLRSCQPMI